ncbi:MAG: Na(+)-translocating NADH-quinone reductase subunit A [Parachlamydiaceae bacterium]|nr:Na(+)-translocating NADH-quinone reductase subunit A [Parachlamydiaceae bacterium]
MHIKITKGLDIPIEGAPQGYIKPLILSGEASSKIPKYIALSLKEFEDLKFRLLIAVGDTVKIGQPLTEDKSTPGRMFVSPAAGIIHEIRRGAKRSLQEIVIAVASTEEYLELSPLDLKVATREQLIERLLLGGIFSIIRARPFNLLADPEKIPRSIFVKALESAPFVPPAEMQILGNEKEFQLGLNALAMLTSGFVHLVYRQNTPCKAFLEALNVEKHTAEGPHPVSNNSVHIQKIDPIQTPNDNIWTLSALDVVIIGHLIAKGRCFTERIISIGGPGILAEREGYFKLRAGFPIEMLVSGRIKKGAMRLVSGDPLMGQKVNPEDFLGFCHTAFCVIPENEEREFLHFFGIGLNKYSFSKAYISGHVDNTERRYPFTTNQHGEHRAFIDSTLYDKVMPLKVPTMLLVKAVMAEDFELAETLGLLEVDSEDFALPTFVCPSKMEMTDIIKKGMKQYAHELA